MQIGCCTNMLAKDAAGTGLHALEAISAAGFDYVELPLAQISALPDSEIDAALEQLKRFALPCLVCNNFFPASHAIVGPDVDTTWLEDHLMRSLTVAARLGADVVVFGSGASKQVPAGFSVKKAREQIVQLLHRAAPMAQKLGLHIALEPQVRAESDITNTWYEALALSREIDHPAVGTLVDYYHLTGEQEPAQILAGGAGELLHVHFARYRGRVFPALTEEESGYAPFFEALRSRGYDGTISVEARSHDHVRDMVRAAAFLRHWCD